MSKILIAVFAIHFATFAQASDVDSVCGSVMNDNSPANTQKLQYCQAAQSAEESVDANSALWKVWGGVAVVCASACAASMMGAAITGYDTYICMGANVAGGATDALVTKNFASALTGIMTAGGSYMINSMNKPAEEAIKEGTKEGTKEAAKNQKPQKDWGSCLSAAVATAQAYSKYNQMQSSEQTVQSNLQSAQNLASLAANTRTDTSILPPGSTSGGIGGASSLRAGGSVGVPTAAAHNNVSDVRSCTNFRTQGTYEGFIQCAIANDKTLPSFVTSPNFPKEFKNSSGIPLPEFAQNSKSPTPALASAMGGKMNSEQSNQLITALRNVENHYMMNDTGTSYASGGGGGSKSGADHSGNEMGDMMSKFMGQFMPGQVEEKQKLGVDTAAFGIDRKIASAGVDISQDRTVSLFDRVTYRYGRVARGGF